MSSTGGASPGYGGSGNDDNSSTGSPNTAMIILYSITGIITVLFLVIIITGAVRAHRHPERYGPRYRAGRTRQSRARGIARAMLETIPIVKFGDEEPESRRGSVKGDVEMSLEPETAAGEPNHNKTSTHEMTQPAAAPDDPSAEEKRKSAAPDTTGNFSCPICTDDFIKGQDLRVLPCNHKFHPECIDPWLVNVSGTCPLCRIDLNPTQAEQQEPGQGPEQEQHDEAGSPIEVPEAARVPGHGHGHGHDHDHDHDHGHSHDRGHTRQPRRLTGYLQNPLNARRMRDATVEERLAALRSVREEANRHADPTHEQADEQRRHHRLSARLRERLRIGTRPTDVPV